MRLIERPAFDVLGRKTWISGPDNSLFGRFWQSCTREGLFAQFAQMTNQQPGPNTNGVTLGISRVEDDPANRAFYYMIAVEKLPAASLPADVELYRVPAALWAVFECVGPIPDSIAAAEMHAFTGWLPTSGYIHAPAPEMEVYTPDGCEFWLPVVRKP